MTTTKVIRYVRPYADNENCTDVSERFLSNLGGATFVFDMDYDTREVVVRFSICSMEDNFSKELGLQQAYANPTARKFNLDRFQKFADIEGGFVAAFLAMLETDRVRGELTQSEKNLLRKMDEQGLLG